MTGKTRTSARSGGPAAPRRAPLCLSFLTRDEFTREYWRSLANGGVFIISADRFEPRELVEIQLELLFRDEVFHLDAEVVHIVPQELARAGGTPGIAVQFLMDTPTLRNLLGDFAGPKPRDPAEPPEAALRDAPRAPARVTAHLDTSSGRLEALTRDLSRSGVLLAVDGERVPVGEKVRVSLVHPTTGEELEVDAKVVRHAETESGRAALGIRFETGDSPQHKVQSFVDNVQAAEHTRRLGGITGAIQELGFPNLLQMLATCSPLGTVTVTREDQVGTLVFRDGNLVSVRLGPVSGAKALKRLLSWSEGRFEFHAVADAADDADWSIRIDAAVLGALSELDEEEQIGTQELPSSARLRVDPAKLEAERSSLDETAEALIELAEEAFTVGAMLDMVPESDAKVAAALQDLLARGVVELVP
ncbi:MAG: PilZ domain-containing protein [Deltaproteobacteria bacterium]|nr:MAG: PilZ domain-containing protein [Deltaproteobacteria bacterium]